MEMKATLNIGQTIGDYRVEEFVKASDENGGETYFVCGIDGKKALMKLYAVETKAAKYRLKTNSLVVAVNI